MAAKGQNNRRNFIKNDLSLEILRGLDSPSPNNNSDDESEIELFNQERKAFERRIKQADYVHKQEITIFSTKEKQAQQQIKTLQEELTKLAQSVNNLRNEVKTAAIQTVVDPGTYHINFFEKLISFVKLLAKEAEDASTWVQMHNARGKKKSHYWGQVKKSGSKFLLSQERYMATQAG